MRCRLLSALLILWAPALAMSATESDAIAAIDACVDRLDAQIDVGYDRIAQRCPELAPALEQSGWAMWLPRGWKESRNDLSAGSLMELRKVVARELASRSTARAPSVDALKEILTGLGSATQERSGLWARFKKWLRSMFERTDQQNDAGWLSRLVSRVGVSDTVLEIITYIALGLVVALAAFIVANELRLAGVLKRTSGANAGAGESGVPSDRPRLAWSDVERAPLADQPRLVLELIAAKLTDLKRLPPAGAFTVRELVRAADLEQSDDRQRLNDIALTSERVRYADADVPPALVESAVGNGRELLAKLDARGAGDAAGESRS